MLYFPPPPPTHIKIKELLSFFFKLIQEIPKQGFLNVPIWAGDRSPSKEIKRIQRIKKKKNYE